MAKKIDILNQVFLNGGPVAAVEYGNETGLHGLVAKIKWGEYRPNKKFGPAAAKARPKALAWLAKNGQAKKAA